MAKGESTHRSQSPSPAAAKRGERESMSASMPPTKVRKVAEDTTVTPAKHDAGALSSLVNGRFTSRETTRALSSEFAAGKPFPHILLRTFLSDPQFCTELREELLHEDFHLKSNDLYEFYQTAELNTPELGMDTGPASDAASGTSVLASSSSAQANGSQAASIDDSSTPAPAGGGDTGESAALKRTRENSRLRQLRDLFVGEEFRSWLGQVTGVGELTDTVDMFGAIYNDGGYLLCHDDRLESRRVAYILYLVPENWSASNGGQLDLFGVERDGVPTLPAAKSILPEFNSFAAFTVSENSFHQVREVTGSLPRVTISGWFHGPPLELPKMDPIKPYITPSLVRKRSVELSKWINPKYLDPETQKQIQEQFEAESNINLEDFLLPARFNAVKAQLPRVSWESRGPPMHCRHYGAGDVRTGNAAQELLAMLNSEEFADHLRRMTDVDVRLGKGELRKFSRGCYTLMNDNDSDRLEEGVDCILHLFGGPEAQHQHAMGNGNGKAKAKEGEGKSGEWREEWGGYMSYNDDEGELISVWPKENALSLVYRVPGNSRFVKYLSHSAPLTRYDAFVTFQESPEKEDAGSADA